MRFHVADLLKGPRGATRVIQIDEQPLFELEGARLLGNVTGTVELMRTQQGILVRAKLQADAEVTCARCLKAAPDTLRVEFEEEFHPTIDVFTGHKVWPEPEEFLSDDIMIDEQHVLDLDEPARQEFQVAIPIKPLCREDCPGICPACGQDLSEGQCQCGPEPDARWSELRDFLNEVATEEN
ncbi:MAG: YceD family protein [Anaerolineae bacterium]